MATISEFLKALAKTDDDMAAERAKTTRQNWALVVTQLGNYVRKQTGMVGLTFMEHPGKVKTHMPVNVEHLLKDWTGERIGFRFQGAKLLAIKDLVINEIQEGKCAGCGKDDPFQELDHKNMKPR